MAKLILREGRSIEDIKEALNLLVLFCRDNKEFKHYESALLLMEDRVNENTANVS